MFFVYPNFDTEFKISSTFLHPKFVFSLKNIILKTFMELVNNRAIRGKEIYDMKINLFKIYCR